MKHLDIVQFDRMADACRQLSYALESGEDLDAAFRTAREGAGPVQVQALVDLERLFKSDSGQESPFAALAWGLRESPASQRYAKDVIAEFKRRQIFAASAGAVVQERMANSFGYLMAVLAILCVVRFEFGVFVMPGFTRFYAGVGAQMPTLTRLVFGSAAPLFSLLLLAGLALLVFLAWYARVLRGQLWRDAPMPGWSLRVPLMGRVAAAFDRYLWMGYAAQLLAGGVDATRSVNLAGARFTPAFAVASEILASALPGNLQAAQRLGRLSDEIRFQQQAGGEQFLDIVIRVQRRARMVLSAFVYALVAAIVCAMYLPIFSLGSNI